MPPEGGSHGISRRDVMTAGGGSVAAALAGCSRLLDGGDGPQEQVDEGEIPDEPIQAGLQDFTEGPAAVLGILGVRGARIAVDRINEAGGIAGREMELEVVHEGSNQVENHNAFIEADKDVTFGPRSSGGHLAMAPNIEDSGVVNVALAGTTTALFEETVTDPTYTFRAQNHDALETVAAAFTAVDQLGADNIDTVAGINPNYAFGQDEMEIFTAAIQKLTGAEVAYSGFPELGASDMSTHVSSVKEEQPDVLFTSLWGGDATLMYEQGISNGTFEDVGLVSGTVTYAPQMTQDMIESIGSDVYMGDRNWHWSHPPENRWAPGIELAQAAWDRGDGDRQTIFHAIMDGYGAVTAWATAVEKAVNQLGRWPEQEEIAQALKGHAWYTPAGYHMMTDWNQQMRPHHSGRLEWSDEYDVMVMEDMNVYRPAEVSPPGRENTLDWIDSW